jgi:hypothetical protein
MGGSVVAVHRFEVSLHVYYHLQTKNIFALTAPTDGGRY